MSIASEITRINNNISSAYTACNNKGATMPVTQNSANLATCIGSISQSSGLNREVVNGVYSTPTTSFTFTLPSGATDIGSHAMCYAFYGGIGLTSANLSSLTTLSNTSALDHAFESSGLTSVNLSNLTTISGDYAMESAFKDCIYLTSIDLSSLTTITGNYAMYGAFNGCTGLTSISFPSLTPTSFGSYTSQFSNMLNGVTGCTVHFPTSLQSVIGNWTSVQNGFGGTNTTVLFDIAGETTRTITLASSDLGGSMDSDSSAVANSIFGAQMIASCMWSESQFGPTTDYTFTTPSAGTTLTVQAISMDEDAGAIQNSVLVVVNNTNVLSYPSYTGDTSAYMEDPTSIPQGSVNLAGNTQVTLRFIEPTGFYTGVVYQMSWTEVVPSS